MTTLPLKDSTVLVAPFSSTKGVLGAGNRCVACSPSGSSELAEVPLAKASSVKAAKGALATGWQMKFMADLAQLYRETVA
jgi:hypothetical protein